MKFLRWLRRQFLIGPFQEISRARAPVSKSLAYRLSRARKDRRRDFSKVGRSFEEQPDYGEPTFPIG